MLSPETEKKINDLLLGIAYGEQKIDKFKQEILSKFILSPQHIFYEIDLEHKGNIIEEDIIKFLSNFGISCSQSEAKFLIFFYDKNMDGTIDFIEFLDLLISDSDYLFKKLSKKKFVKGIQEKNEMTSETIKIVSELFKNEIDLLRYISELVQIIKTSEDFSLQDMFFVIKSYSFITFER